jgi:beta-glucosidase
LKAEYFRGRELQGASVFSRVDPTVDFRWYRGSPTSDLVARGEVAADHALDNDNFSARWTGQIVPPASGTYTVVVAGDDGFRLFVDGKPVIDNWTTSSRASAKTAEVTLEAGKAVDVRLEYFEAERDAEIRLAWQLPGAKPPMDEALDAARASDVTIFVGGLTGDVEGEEMQVSYPGFAGGDRTDIALPAPQEQLLEALAATGKPIVFVQMAGSAVVSPWASEHLPAILVAWYPGQRGGNAIADVLFGDVNPAGRLPVTFYRGVDQLPAFDDYAMTNRTYRYFTGTPLYPFGYGLSYTRFNYSDLALDRAQITATDAIEASVTVTNTGQRAGDEVVQLYERAVSPSRPMPVRQLRGFSRVTLAPGESKRVTFRLRAVDDFGFYDEARKAFAVDPGDYEVAVGGSSADLPVKAIMRVQ